VKQINDAFTMSFAPDTYDAQVSMLHHLHGITVDMVYTLQDEERTTTFMVGPIYGDSVLLHPFPGETDLTLPIANIIHIQYC
jgi:hypothetical protein